ncbi:MAG: UvrD-helicase domain-containing protein [Candidatus Cyclobacteriaceae bacterium M3_2C_046]
MSKRNFRIYRSSAGSGKTFTLAREYLTLVLKNPWLYKNILAVTFTNKATREMKVRIIQYLHEIARGDNNLLIPVLCKDTNLDQSELVKRAQQVLILILHNYSHFSISTIDSFFQKIIQGFARELGLQGGFSIELDQEKVLDELVDMLLIDLGKNQQLTSWLIQFAEQKVIEGSSWDIRKDMKGLAREIFQEKYKAFVKPENLNSHSVPSLLQELNRLIQHFEKEMAQIGSDAINLMESHQLEVDDFTYGKSGVIGYFNKIRLKVFRPGERVTAALHRPEQWYKKSSPLKAQIEQAYHDGLNHYLDKALQFFYKEFPRYISAVEIQRYIYTLGILLDLNQKLVQYRQDKEVLLISDATDFLKKIIGNNDAPFIYEKTGSLYRHYLIDEFQDTSGFQWDNFKPLLINSLAEGNLNLVVGDIKQSIYRWRGGNWELLLYQVEKDIKSHNVHQLHLNQNWRSKPELIAFFNQFFQLAPQLLQVNVLSSFSELLNQSLKKKLEQESLNILKAYQDAIQKIPVHSKDKQGGMVKIDFYDRKVDTEEEEEMGWRDQVFQKLPATIESLQDQHYQPHDIAFLVRRQEEGAAIIEYLMEYKQSDQAKKGYQYDVLSSESLFLKKSSSIKILINALRYLKNDSDLISLSLIGFEYQIVQGQKLENPADWFNNVRDRAHELIPPAFFKNKWMYQNLGLYELIEQLIQVFQLNRFLPQIPYLQAFQDLILEYNQNGNGNNLDQFLDYWELTGSNKSLQIPSEVNAMQVMTIHKSKGLQFKVVIIPFCDWNLDHNTRFDNILWCRSQESPFSLLEVLPLKYSQSLLDTIYCEDYYREKIKAAIDNLNLLYVAFTRAEDQLLISAVKPTIKKNGGYNVASVSDLVYQVLNDCNIPENKLTDYWQEQHQTMKMGTTQTQIRLKFDTPPKDAQEQEAYITSQWQDQLKIRQSAANIFNRGQETHLENARYGTLIHNILAQVKWKSDLNRVLNQYYYEGVMGRREMEQLKLQIEKLLQLEPVDDWFSDGWEVKSEIPVITPGGHQYRFDRIMMKGSEVVLVDYKTGAKSSSHQHQVKRYAELLGQMGYTNVNGYLLYIDQVEVEKVV